MLKENLRRTSTSGAPSVSSLRDLNVISRKNIIGTIAVDNRGNVLEINDYYLRILGYTRDEFERNGLNIIAITPEDHLPYLIELEQTGKVETFERSRLRKDGTVVWVLTGYVESEENPSIALGWALDITDKKRAELTSQYLLEANKILASSVELQPLLEKIAEVALVNGFCDFCTIHFPEGESLACRALMHRDPELTHQVRQIIERYPRYLSEAIGPARVIRTGIAEMSVRSPDAVASGVAPTMGALSLKSYMSVPLKLEGKTIGALTLTSLTRNFDPKDLETAEALALRASQHIENAKLHESLKQSSLELERSNRDLSYFASIAAHDLKSPLATSQSYLYALLDEGGLVLSSTQRLCIEKAIASNNKMLSQIDRLLTFSHFKREQFLVQSVRLEKVVDSAIDNLKTEVERSKAQISYSDLPVVRGDATLLTLLFQNLLSNSIRYCGSEALKIEISADRSTNGWTISVKDNGRGFDSQCAEKIFRLFEQLPDAKSDDGQGIGLATCLRIVEAHGGKIWAEGHLNEGAVFSFTLPNH